MPSSSALATFDAPRRLAHHDAVGLLGDRTGRGSPARDDRGLGPVAGVARDRSGDDDGLARERRLQVSGRLDRLFEGEAGRREPRDALDDSPLRDSTDRPTGR